MVLQSVGYLLMNIFLLASHTPSLFPWSPQRVLKYVGMEVFVFLLLEYWVENPPRLRHGQHVPRRCFLL